MKLQKKDIKILVISGIVLIIGLVCISGYIFLSGTGTGLGSIPVADDYAISEIARDSLNPQQDKKPDKAFEQQIQEVRYRNYLHDAIIEKLGDYYKKTKAKAELLFKVNKNGYVESYTIDIVSDPETKKRKITFEQEAELVKKLQDALLAASPFQPFPPSVQKENYILGIGVGDGQEYGIIYADENREPYWEYKINQTGKPRNPKKYQDSKITDASVFVEGWKAGHKVYGVQLYQSDINLNWEPVKNENNHVIVRGIIKNGKITKPAFIKKSKNIKANESAIKALLAASVPKSDSPAGKMIDELKSYSDMLTIELHFEVK